MKSDSVNLDVGTRYAALDAWRGVACLLVLAFHAAIYVIHDPPAERPSGFLRVIYAPLNHGYIGVGIFFVISGYCIAATCDSTLRRGKSMGEFFKRRIRRIYPPYLIALGIALLWMVPLGLGGGGHILRDGLHDVPDSLRLSSNQWLGNLTLTEEWLPHIVGGQKSWIVGQAWSLCYEEQFYIVCGLVLLLWPKRFYSFLFALTAVVCVSAAYQYRFGQIQSMNGFFFDGRWMMFGAGVVVFYRLNRAGRQETIALDTVLVGTAVVCGLIAYRHPGWQTIERSAALLFAVMLLPLRRWDAVICRNRLAKPLLRCGRMCYSLYLIHWPLCKLVSGTFYRMGVRGPWVTLLVVVPMCLAISIPLAAVFYVLVERRFLNPPAAIGANRLFSEQPERPKSQLSLSGMKN